MVFVRARVIDDRAEKLQALFAVSGHRILGRWQDVREPSEEELQQPTVLSLPIKEGSAKIRTGPPLDDEEDYALPVWAGVIPLKVVAETPIADPRLPANIPIPDYAARYSRSLTINNDSER